ncbi:type VI secretion system baseplate subunit TssF [Burkholderia aenigmatica]|uniref:type VI secretion system baseplate subunit TssF n=1 Tax=Burkholderia aenigmatica TaxID=2015348 RepID=UPI001F01901B|nr:type VI secretion system baseplate subunit TssF [Burkholderia aenigmatica]UKD13725.1 type VI secretion system baseplate subunit TssF [Burkholderia aenigmatica]
MAIDPDDLLPYFEREMAWLRRSMRTFAQRVPKIAARLAITGEHSEDPHVERLLQSFALLAAHHKIRLEDDIPAFTRALLETLHGAFLRPFPSCAIAQFHGRRDTKQTEPRFIPCGTQLVAPARQVFCTAADVTLVPLAISAVRYTTSAVAPMQAILPADTTGLLSITLELTSQSALWEIAPDVLRLHLTGAREVVAALADGVLLHTARAFVELDDSGRWSRVDMPLAAAGFDDADSLLPMPRDAAVAPYHLLMEYGAFPARFDWLDWNLERLKRTAANARRATLHLALTGIHPDSHCAQRLAAVSIDNLRLFCAPVVNLFPSAAEPIETQAGLAYYALKPLAAKTAAAKTEVWLVDQVRQAITDGAAILPPFESLQHVVSKVPALYWILLRDEARRAPKAPAEPLKPGLKVLLKPAAAANVDPLRGLELALVNANGAPADPAETRQLDITLSCTNGNLANMRERHLALRAGDSAGDIVLLAAPSPSSAPVYRHGELWELLSWLVPQAIRLNVDGLGQFKQMCTRFAMTAPDAGRRFDALTSLSAVRVRRWIPGKPASAFVPGLEIRLAIDEQRFAQFSLDGLGRILDRLFAPYVQINSFVQITLLSANTGVTLRSGEPCPGLQPPV